MCAQMTMDELNALKFKAVLFGDGAKGSAFQSYRCLSEPRITVRWARKDRNDKGTQTIYVDGKPVADKEAALAALNAPKEDG